jgi:hypothetical protein
MSIDWVCRSENANLKKRRKTRLSKHLLEHSFMKMKISPWKAKMPISSEKKRRRVSCEARERERAP